MKLNRVTITGADDTVDPGVLADLSREFPFVEWGILFSEKRQGKSRYPSANWLSILNFRSGQVSSMKLSAHLCGSYVRNILLGVPIFPPYPVIDNCQRFQLNIAPHSEYRSRELSSLLVGKSIIPKLVGGGRRQFIFQVGDGKDEIFENARDEPGSGIDTVPLFDSSGGNGILPNRWPKADYIDVTPGPNGDGVEFPIYHGYAGGLNPDNLAEQLPRIAEAAGNAPFWIDMESGVRAANGTFDLSKVRKCLEIAVPYVSAPVPA